jgi:uncharacterized protein (DUF2147 family)
MNRRDAVLAPLAIGPATALLLAWACATSAQFASPVGLWKTYSDRTGEAEGLVRIVEERGEFVGRVEKVFSPPNDSPNPLCERCAGELRDQPVVGMAILRGVRRGQDGYTEGTILDPDEGENYRCSLTLKEAGRLLEIRGFIGLSLFGRTQVWTRVE